MTEFMTMRDLGGLIGWSSHRVGQRLKNLGLRTSDGKPSRTAFAQGLVEQRWANDGRGYCWAWHKTRVLPLLDGPKAGRSSTTEIPTADAPASDR